MSTGVPLRESLEVSSLLLGAFVAPSLAVHPQGFVLDLPAIPKTHSNALNMVADVVQKEGNHGYWYRLWKFGATQNPASVNRSTVDRLKLKAAIWKLGYSDHLRRYVTASDAGAA